jgi:hypothetical protein
MRAGEAREDRRVVFAAAPESVNQKKRRSFPAGRGEDAMPADANFLAVKTAQSNVNVANEFVRVDRPEVDESGG